MTKPVTVFTRNTLIPVGLVFTLVAAAVSFGIQMQKIEEISKTIEEMRTEIKEIRNIGSTTIYSDYDSVKDFCTKFVRNIK